MPDAETFREAAKAIDQFVWAETNEGEDYWGDVHSRLLNHYQRLEREEEKPLEVTKEPEVDIFQL